MSYNDSDHPDCSDAQGAIKFIIKPKEKDLGEFTVRRVLPAMQQRMVGPFVFFDHMGPAEFPPGKGIQVRPHPHIGLSTITYLFDGEIMHEDSLGHKQAIKAEAVNLMTAGRGIVHSERAGSDLNLHSTLHGIQSWIALPNGQEEIEPSFVHYPASDIPETHVGDATVRVIMGAAYGQKSPVKAYSETIYLECLLPAGADLTLPNGFKDLAAYVVSGEIHLDGEAFSGGVMVVACDDGTLKVEALTDSRIMVIGGEPLGERHLWWNFVHSSPQRIEQAKVDWKNGNFDMVNGDDEFIPLPES